MLKRRIIEDGTELGTEVVKVDSFLNHQLDIGLFMAIGKEISRRFGDLGINKILTIESSGIGIAAITALYFGYFIIQDPKRFALPALRFFHSISFIFHSQLSHIFLFISVECM